MRLARSSLKRRDHDFSLLPLKENAWTDEGYSGTKAPSSGASRHLPPRVGRENISDLYFTSSTNGSSVARFKSADFDRQKAVAKTLREDLDVDKVV